MTCHQHIYSQRRDCAANHLLEVIGLHQSCQFALGSPSVVLPKGAFSGVLLEAAIDVHGIEVEGLDTLASLHTLDVALVHENG